MRIIRNENTDLRFNLAAEEYMINHFVDEIFMLWRAEPSILLGKNQNAYSEINMDYVAQHNIRVVRRMSGGGAVYNDLGNTNFCFIMNESDKHFADFKRFTGPIIDVLRALGIDAEFSGRNDMTIDGKKFSGNAQYRVRSRMLHHGTLLFKSDIVDLTQSLNPSPAKYSDRAIKSVRSRVTNIWDHLPDKSMDIMTFRQRINAHIMELYPDAVVYTFTPEDITAIEELVRSKYDTWEWNFGKSPEFNYQAAKRLSGGVVEVYAQIRQGCIQSVEFHGDYFGLKASDEISNALIGQPLKVDSLQSILAAFEIDEYFKGITGEELMTLFFE